MLGAPSGYSAGDLIVSSAVFAGDTFDITSFPDQSGSYAGGGNTLVWTTAAVPEPSYVSVVFGFVVVSFVLGRRR